MKLKFYEHNKKSPVKQFIDLCNDQVFEKISRQIKYLNEYGLRSEVINLKKLRGYPIWEVRIIGRDNLRILCCQSNDIIWILHIFAKKSMKTPLKDLAIGLKRYNEIIDN